MHFLVLQMLMQVIFEVVISLSYGRRSTRIISSDLYGNRTYSVTIIMYRLFHSYISTVGFPTYWCGVRK